MMNREREEKNKHAGKPEQAARNLSEEQSASFPVIEENIEVDKKTVETAKVRLSKKAHEEEEIVELPEIHEEIDIERIPINEFLHSAPPPVRQEGDTTIYPVLKEVAVVEKRLMLVEEVRVSKRRTQSSSTKKVSLRKEEVSVKREKKNSVKQQKD